MNVRLCGMVIYSKFEMGVRSNCLLHFEYWERKLGPQDTEERTKITTDNTRDRKERQHNMVPPYPRIFDIGTFPYPNTSLWNPVVANHQRTCTLAVLNGLSVDEVNIRLPEPLHWAPILPASFRDRSRTSKDAIKSPRPLFEELVEAH